MSFVRSRLDRCASKAMPPNIVQNMGIRRPLQRSSVRDILDLRSKPRSDDSGLETCSLDLLNPTIWYLYRDPARCGVDGNSMEIRWRFHGIRWIFDGWAPSGPEASSPGLEPSGRAWKHQRHLGQSQNPSRQLQDTLRRFWDFPEAPSDQRKR